MNKYLTDDEKPIDVLKVDNAEVRAEQIGKLEKLRAERDETACNAALEALSNGAAGDANLLDLCIKAAGAHASVGEMSDAMERAFTRHKAVTKAISGVYRNAALSPEQLDKVASMVDVFKDNDGNKPRILVAKMGQDGHDRGQKVIASAFIDIGFEVEIGDLFATPEEVADQAKETGVDIVGVSSLAAGHLTLVPALKQALKERGLDHIMIVCGGVIPPQDYDELMALGADAIFPPGTVISEAAEKLVTDLNARKGYEQKPLEAYL